MTGTRRVRVRGWWLASAGGGLGFVVPWPADGVEAVYSRGIYPPMQAAITSLSNLASFAVVDVLLLVLGIIALWWLGRTVWVWRARGALSATGELVRRVVRLAGLTALVFLVFWGLNYRRPGFEVLLGGGAAPSAEAVLSLASRSAGAAGRVRGTDLSWPADYEALATRLAPAFTRALEQLDLPVPGVLGRPKISRILTPFFTAAGVTGMMNPWALETIVHPDLLPFERPMVLAHEWAHQAGLADEADASALAWAACVTADPAFAYSAHLFVVIETSAAIGRSEWQALRAGLAPGVVDDLAALAKRLTRQQPVVRETTSRVYDGYLRSNRVPDGVRSYGRAIRVLLTPRMRELVDGQDRSSLSISSAVMGRADRPVRRSSDSASGPSDSGR